MLSTIFDTVKTGLEMILTGLGEPLPLHVIGEENLPNPGTLPSIVWVPRGAKKIEMIGGPRAPMAVRLTKRGATPQPNNDTGRIDSPNQVARRDELVHIYVRNAGFRETEILMNHLVACMRVQLTAFSFRPIETDWSIGWPVETNEPTRNIQSGTQCILACYLAVPFTFEQQPIARSPLGLTVDGEFVDNLS
jgi:hypothetical protein